MRCLTDGGTGHDMTVVDPQLGGTVQENQFAAYMKSRNLADATCRTRISALRRIENAHNLDLDAEYEKDRLEQLRSCFSYTAADQRQGAPNPSQIEIEPERLQSYIGWYRTHLLDYLRFKGAEFIEPDDAPPTVEAASEIIEEAIGKTFALERDLQNALRSNLDQLEAGLKAVDDGREKKVAAGFIDILARDHDGTLTIIELKADMAKPDAVAQILAYMGCIAEEYKEPVRGILVAGDHHPRVGFAARALQNLVLKTYRYRFEFE